jgi:peptide/nickel transport system ATP-binding protein/oligopeptide transport system ATP-binding protein
MSPSVPVPVTLPGDPGPPLLEVHDVRKYFPIRAGLLGRGEAGAVRAVDGVTLEIQQGETLGLVGESGCGKTTLGRVVLRLETATSGAVLFRGANVFEASRRELMALRRSMQIIFQDPYSSLDPRMTVGAIVAEGPVIHGIGAKSERADLVARLLARVGLSPSAMDRYPHEFSGGQRQRVGIARALALDPELIICDEPVSALDVSIQSQVLNLLADLQEEYGLTYLFIAHNLAVVKHVSDRVGVMYLGRIVELADTTSLYREPRHPYTLALLSAIPEPDPHRGRRRLVLQGDVPSPASPPSGCRFHTRCWLREQLGRPDSCTADDPPLRDLGGGHLAACHWAESITPEAVDLATHGAAAAPYPSDRRDT